MAFRRRQQEREEPLGPSGPVGSAALALDRDAVLEQALSEPRLLLHVAKAARSSWRAAAWLLERTHPEHWAAGREPGPAALPGDVFAEVDELARRRRLHSAHPVG
jgi:hypothetical protein